MNIALVDKYDKRVNYSSIFPNLEIDEYHLSSLNKKKLLKADKDIEIDTDQYDFIILVGADATKHFTKAVVATHQGYLVDDKYLPLIDPSMLIFKPSMRDAYEHAIENIIGYIDNTKEKPKPRESIGIEDTSIALEVLKSKTVLFNFDIITVIKYISKKT